MPYSDPEKRKAARREADRKRRQSPLVKYREDQASARRMQAKREKARPKPVTEAEMLKDAGRFGPATDGPLDNVYTGVKGIGTLLENVISGRGYKYNAENT